MPRSKHRNRNRHPHSIQRSTPITSRDIFDVFPRRTSSAGVSVNRDTVFGLPAFHRGISLISTTCARIPCHVFEREANGGRRKAIEHSGYRLLRKQANPFLTAFNFIRQLVANSLYAGNGYGWIQKDDLGQPLALWNLDSEATTPMIVYGRSPVPELWYSYVSGGHAIPLDPSEVIHIRGLGCKDGLCGMRLIDVVRESLGLGIAVIKYGAVYFKNGGGTGATVVELPTEFKNQEAIDTFRRGLEGLHGGLDNAHRVALLSGGAKLNRSPVSNEEAQWLASREMTAVDVANILGLPGHKLNAKINSSYSSIEAENLALLSDCYDGILVNLEQELETKLLAEEEKESDSHYIEFMRDALTRADAKTEVDSLINQLNNGLISWEECRQKRNLPTVKAEAEEWRLPNNVKIEGEEPEPPPAPSITVAEPEAEPEEDPQEEEPKGKELVRGNVNRVINRLRKDQPAGKQALYQRHGKVISEAFPRCEEWVSTFLGNLGEELEASLPEQRATILDSLDTEAISEELWKLEFMAQK